MDISNPGNSSTVTTAVVVFVLIQYWTGGTGGMRPPTLNWTPTPMWMPIFPGTPHPGPPRRTPKQKLEKLCWIQYCDDTISLKHILILLFLLLLPLIPLSMIPISSYPMPSSHRDHTYPILLPRTTTNCHPIQRQCKWWQSRWTLWGWGHECARPD